MASYLNDHIVNFFFSLLAAWHVNNLVFHSTFMQSLFLGGRCYNFNNLKRWTMNVNIFAKKLLLIPICHCLHWTLLICFMELKLICYYNSLGGPTDPNKFMDNTLRYKVLSTLLICT